MERMEVASQVLFPALLKEVLAENVPAHEDQTACHFTQIR